MDIYGTDERWKERHTDRKTEKFRQTTFKSTSKKAGHNGVKIGENVYFCIKIKKALVNWPKIAFHPLKSHFSFCHLHGKVTKKAVERPR